jgi:hypothetical protein
MAETPRSPEKTPGTHKSDDHSQQPRQHGTPTKREDREIDKEDRTGMRDRLLDDKKPDGEQ